MISPKYLRKPDVLARVPVSAATLERWVALGKFPRPVKLGPRAVAWLESEVSAWEASRIDARRAPETVETAAA